MEGPVRHGQNKVCTYLSFPLRGQGRGWLTYALDRILTRDPGLLRELLKEARKLYKTANGHLINVFVAQG